MFGFVFFLFRFQKVRSAQQAAHNALNRGEFLAHNRLSSYEDKVVSVFHARDHRAKRFPQPAFDAIADDAVAKLLLTEIQREPEAVSAFCQLWRKRARAAGPPWIDLCGIHGGTLCSALKNNSVSPVGFHHVFVLPRTDTAGKRFVFLRKAHGKRSVPVPTACRQTLIKLLRRQSFPALKPSAGKYVPAVLGLHALTKTVNLLALPFLGLIRLKHVGAPLFQLF